MQYFRYKPFTYLSLNGIIILEIRKGVDKMYRLYYSESMGYCIMEYNKESLFWQQLTKWYTKLGNLKRYNPQYF